MEKSEYGTADKAVQENSSMEQVQQQPSVTSGESVHEKKPWWHPVIEPGSAVQIIIAAAIAVAIGLGVKTAHPDIPSAATTILIIPGNLWLRALKAVVLPLIVTAMILAVQKLKEISNGGAKLAKWTIGYYVITTIVAIVHSIIMTSQVWARLMNVASAESIATDSMSEKDQESCSPAWLTAWGTASSAATLSVTMRCCRETLKIPETVNKFAVPLGCLVNMDGTAIYFPIVVVFLAQTQGHVLNAADYIIILLLSTLASIGTTPIPSSSLVLTVMISSSVGIPPSGMYGVVVAIDWFIDRFRTATNVSGDLFAAVIVTKMTGITDPDDGSEDVVREFSQNQNDERV
ncbi:excitatory amino acid transporter 2 [Colletotrichum higginsianum]|nr:excitatory amino acid transporter 2 [Colletotrichum higginsianum]